MDGCARAAQRRLEEGITEAWHVEAFARETRLKKLSHYLQAVRGPAEPQTPEQMLDAIRASGGDKMRIRFVPKQEAGDGVRAVEPGRGEGA